MRVNYPTSHRTDGDNGQNGDGSGVPQNSEVLKRDYEICEDKRKYFMQRILTPFLESGLLRRTVPDKFQKQVFRSM